MIKSLSICSSNINFCLSRNKDFVLRALVISSLISCILFGLSFHPNQFLSSSLAPLFGTLGVLSILDYLLLRSKFNTAQIIIERLLEEHSSLKKLEPLTQKDEAIIINNYEDYEIDSLLSYSSNLDTINLLISKKRFVSNPNATSKKLICGGDCPLTKAIKAYNNALIEILWKTCDVQKPDCGGITPFHHLMRQYEYETEGFPSFLKDDPIFKTRLAAEELYMAISKGNHDYARLLVDLGVILTHKVCEHDSRASKKLSIVRYASLIQRSNSADDEHRKEAANIVMQATIVRIDAESNTVHEI